MPSNGFFFFVSALLLCQLCSALPVEVDYNGRAITIDGDRRIIISGSIHYPRSTPEMWPDLIQKAKDGGLNAIDTYVFWNAHESMRRQYDFSGNLDLVRFIQTIQKAGLYAILRIGPYVCAEWNYGGFPVWLHNIPGIKLRTNNDIYKNEMQTFTALIVDMMKHENLFASQGGPVIIAQIENEYGNVIGSYGNQGKQYLQWCADLAESYQIGVPWIMCQQKDAPQPIINTCNGWYCDQFQPSYNTSPKMWTENWTGWFKNWGMQDPHRTAEDLAFSVARFFQLQGTFQNYYMYHGGTNFGRSAGGPYITTSYDYDAPLDEYGNLNQPKWGHLKELHNLIRSMEKVLTYGFVREVEYGESSHVTVYSYGGNRSCFISNANRTTDITINFENFMYSVPAWSVTILPDCHTDVYNTAQVNVQTSIMEKVLNEADTRVGEPYELIWGWRPENLNENGLVLHSNLTTNQLLDQKVVTNDTSDYLWYITSLDHNAIDPNWTSKELTLRVNSRGHILHAFINGEHIGTEVSGQEFNPFTLERRIELQHDKNDLSLLSVTVGLKHYNPFFDETDVGIHGPVQLIGKYRNGTEVTKDLSKNEWTYKVGLAGEQKGLYQITGHAASFRWTTNNLPTDRMFVWYKTIFKAPLGTDPVVVDLRGLGKGHAWVNGRSIGRYWTSYTADENGCTEKCDYRGTYSNRKCLTNCGKSSQRWYHIPRSFLQDDNNALILFEEFGGNPFNVKFQTVTVAKACANVYEGKVLQLSCQGGRVLSNVRVAIFGDPQGACSRSFRKGQCESPTALSYIQKACIGKAECYIDVSETTLGPTGCKHINRLAVEVDCSQNISSLNVTDSMFYKLN